MPSKIIVTLTENNEQMSTLIEVETNGTDLENKSADILKGEIVSLFRKILQDDEE